MNSRKIYITSGKQYVDTRIQQLSDHALNFKIKTEDIPSEYFHNNIDFYLIHQREEQTPDIPSRVDYTYRIEHFPQSIIETFPGY